MTARARPAARPYRPGGFDPLRTLWALLSNVKFALFLVGLALVAMLVGVVIPQMPGPMRGNPAARSAWLELQRADFGAFTSAMERAQLFEVFYSPWFNGLWVVIVFAVTVCTVSRFVPTWRNVERPQRKVGPAYFERAHHRADFTHPGGVEAIAAALKKRRYQVRIAETREGETHLFADRFAWSAYGTFLSHLGLLLFLVGGVLTRFAGFDTTLALAEQTPGAPVFAKPGPGQMFVRMIDAQKGVDSAGNIIDFRSAIEVTRGGRTVVCTTTVNDPCHAFGYKVHLAAFFDDIARLTVAAPDGRVVWDDNIDFDNKATAAPRFRVTGPDGGTLFEGEVPQQATAPGTNPGPEDDAAIAQLRFPVATGSEAEVAYAVSWRVEGDGLRLAVTGPGLPVRQLQAGDEAVAGPYHIRYTGPASIPALQVGDMPGAGGRVAVQMPSGGAGSYLVINGIDSDDLVLRPGQPVTAANGYTYTFTGRIEASGVNVRRDPGDTFIWIAAGAALLGLCITFYIPRRRLWVRVTPQRTYVAGIAEKTTRLSREFRRLGAELGSRDALRPEDEAPE